MGEESRAAIKASRQAARQLRQARRVGFVPVIERVNLLLADEKPRSAYEVAAQVGATHESVVLALKQVAEVVGGRGKRSSPFVWRVKAEAVSQAGA